MALNVEEQSIVTPERADSMVIVDNSDGNAVKRVTYEGLITLLDGLYAAINHMHTTSDIVGLEDFITNNAAVVLNTAKVSYPGDATINSLIRAITDALTAADVGALPDTTRTITQEEIDAIANFDADGAIADLAALRTSIMTNTTNIGTNTTNISTNTTNIANNTLAISQINAASGQVTHDGGPAIITNIEGGTFVNGTLTVTDESGADVSLVGDTITVEGTSHALITAAQSTTVNAITSTGSGQIITGTERTKLNGIAAGAEVNVQSDWDQTDTTADDYIENKPTIPTQVTFEDDDADPGMTRNLSSITFNASGDEMTLSDGTNTRVFTGGAGGGNRFWSNEATIPSDGSTLAVDTLYSAFSSSSGTFDLPDDAEVGQAIFIQAPTSAGVTLGFRMTGGSIRFNGSTRNTIFVPFRPSSLLMLISNGRPFASPQWDAYEVGGVFGIGDRIFSTRFTSPFSASFDAAINTSYSLGASATVTATLPSGLLPEGGFVGFYNQSPTTSVELTLSGNGRLFVTGPDALGGYPSSYVVNLTPGNSIYLYDAGHINNIAAWYILRSANRLPYSDIVGTPTLGSLAALDSIDYTSNLITNKPADSPLAGYTINGTPSTTDSVLKWTAENTLEWSEDETVIGARLSSISLSPGSSTTGSQVNVTISVQGEVGAAFNLSVVDATSNFVTNSDISELSGIIPFTGTFQTTIEVPAVTSTVDRTFQVSASNTAISGNIVTSNVFRQTFTAPVDLSLTSISISALNFGQSGQTADVTVNGNPGVQFNLSLISVMPTGWITSGALGASSGTIPADGSFETTIMIPAATGTVDRSFVLRATNTANTSNIVDSGTVRQQHTVSSEGNLVAESSVVTAGPLTTISANVTAGDAPFTYILNTNPTDSTSGVIQTLGPTSDTTVSFTGFRAVTAMAYYVHISDSDNDMVVLTENISANTNNPTATVLTARASNGNVVDSTEYSGDNVYVQLIGADEDSFSYRWFSGNPPQFFSNAFFDSTTGTVSTNVNNRTELSLHEVPEGSENQVQGTSLVSVGVTPINHTTNIIDGAFVQTFWASAISNNSVRINIIMRNIRDRNFRPSNVSVPIRLGTTTVATATIVPPFLDPGENESSFVDVTGLNSNTTYTYTLNGVSRSFTTLPS